MTPTLPTCQIILWIEGSRDLSLRRSSVASYVLQPGKQGSNSTSAKHVILCGNSREHPGLVALFSGHCDCPVRGGYKNSRVPIEDTKDAVTRSDSSQHNLGRELIGSKTYRNKDPTYLTHLYI